MTAPLTTEPLAFAEGEGLVCALTVDDGPSAEDTPALLDGLAARGVRAVFAVIGEQIQAPGGAALLRRIVAEGHVLCNHSTSFADMGAWDADAVRADMRRNLEIIREALGDPHADVPYWRAPNGSWGVTAQVAVELGMQPLAVVNVIFDWEDQDPELLSARLRDAMRPGEVVLVHDGPEGRAGTVEAVLRVIDERRAEGWRFTLPAARTVR
ncbi:polysaccharide deacetylase family protein [Demequina zhanjiangensis]|uniref:Polysaccharide deacetylase family protein n=1 Tax=Demequina zhanjiangensis TaxID=3051659 RepID=A0ABT8FY85_9MICO|nr:polysaccharide deacetylase family protein [Demequina sp. SYSU T00b26]MDN4471868.1 polysaccharide deacetylase family protein [Demequina sp. SYSU T00b26]